MPSMNIYRFDRVVYKGNCLLDFYIYILKKHPKVLKKLPVTIVTFLKYLFNFCSKIQLYEKFYSFLTLVPDIDIEITSFWKQSLSKISPWYLKRQLENDLILSCLPEFLLDPLCQKLHISYLIASQVHPKTGLYRFPNTSELERFKHFLMAHPYLNSSHFYSNTLSDLKFTSYTSTSYIVQKNHLITWNIHGKKLSSRFKMMFLSKSFLLFLIIGSLNVFNGILFSLFFNLLFNPNLSFVCGYLCSLLISYSLNSKFTFQEKLSFYKMLKFFIAYVPNFLIQNIIVFIVYNTLNYNKLLAYFLAAFVGLPITFLLIKCYAFVKSNSNPAS